MSQTSKQAVLWLITLIFLSFVGLSFQLFPERLESLHQHWITPDDLDIGYFLLVLFAYFTYKNFTHSQIKPNIYFFPVVLFLAFVFFLAQYLDLKTVFFAALAAFFPAVLVTSLGLNTAKKIIIPWALVVTAMPFWYLAVPVLQTITVEVVSFLSSALSLTALVEGNFFHIPSGVIHVAGGCSGLKYFLTSMALALISSCLSKRGFALSMSSVLIAASFAMIGNWI